MSWGQNNNDGTTNQSLKIGKNFLEFTFGFEFDAPLE